MSAIGFSFIAVCVIIAIAFVGSSGPRPETTNPPVEADAKVAPIKQPLPPPEPTPPHKAATPVEPSDGCDEKARSSAMEYALSQALPKDPFAEPLPQLDGIKVLLPDMTGEPVMVRDESLASTSLPVCVYSTPDISVYVPSAVFTERMLLIRSGELKIDTSWGSREPTQIFKAMTYWSFKHPHGPEFDQFFPASLPSDMVRYEGRIATFDTDRKLALFTTDIYLDNDGQQILASPDHQRLELGTGEYPVILKVAERLGQQINASDRAFSKAAHILLR
jgi:hypothetical protein